MQEYLKITDLKKMGFKDSTIRRWEGLGHFPQHTKIGRDRYWLKQDVEKCLATKIRYENETNNNTNQQPKT